MSEFMDLVYDARAAKAICQRFPHAKIADASDYLHEDRIEVILPECDEDAYLSEAMRDGFYIASLTFQLMLLEATGQQRIRRLLSEMKEAR